jgi:hypothetical protein
MLAIFTDTDEVSIAQDFKVFRHRGLGYPQRVDQLADAHLPRSGSVIKQAQYVSPGGICHHIKNVNHNSVAYRWRGGSTMAGGCPRKDREEGKET